MFIVYPIPWFVLVLLTIIAKCSLLICLFAHSSNDDETHLVKKGNTRSLIANEDNGSPRLLGCVKAFPSLRLFRPLSIIEVCWRGISRSKIAVTSGLCFVKCWMGFFFPFFFFLSFQWLWTFFIIFFYFRILVLSNKIISKN